ncbi:hypothetical protein PR048_029896 [Dryococelus australis]|uniref:Uncharacterized protein n=1 Tax=Dryococelus australis TaxID=614101 RepID=A0ABQ9G7G2_9NEOP|nr:hypothetical protein PR048_029896 [Dryococelus australis]
MQCTLASQLTVPRLPDACNTTASNYRSLLAHYTDLPTAAAPWAVPPSPTTPTGFVWPQLHFTAATAPPTAASHTTVAETGNNSSHFKFLPTFSGLTTEDLQTLLRDCTTFNQAYTYVDITIWSSLVDDGSSWRLAVEPCFPRRTIVCWRTCIVSLHYHCLRHLRYLVLKDMLRKLLLLRQVRCVLLLVLASFVSLGSYGLRSAQDSLVMSTIFDGWLFANVCETEHDCPSIHALGSRYKGNHECVEKLVMSECATNMDLDPGGVYDVETSMLKNSQVWQLKNCQLQKTHRRKANGVLQETAKRKESSRLIKGNSSFGCSQTGNRVVDIQHFMNENKVVHEHPRVCTLGHFELKIKQINGVTF